MLLLLLLVTLSLQRPSGLERSQPSFVFDGAEIEKEWHTPGTVDWVVIEVWAKKWFLVFSFEHPKFPAPVSISIKEERKRKAGRKNSQEKEGVFSFNVPSN